MKWAKNRTRKRGARSPDRINPCREQIDRKYVRIDLVGQVGEVLRHPRWIAGEAARRSWRPPERAAQQREPFRLDVAQAVQPAALIGERYACAFEEEAVFAAWPSD